MIRNSWEFIKTMEVYDCYKKTWTSLAELNQCTLPKLARAFTHNNKIIYQRDSLEHGGRKIYPEMYDPILNTWTILKSGEYDNALVRDCDKQAFLKNIIEKK